jgi:hypothetical protein
VVHSFTIHKIRQLCLFNMYARVVGEIQYGSLTPNGPFAHYSRLD